MSKLTELYTVIAVFGGNSISSIDGAPGYLHLHAIRRDLLASLPSLPSPAQPKAANIIHQWGMPVDKELGMRAPVSTVADIVRYGNVGLGSAAMGGTETECTFVGGGEVFFIPTPEGVKAVRITKGQGLFPLKPNDAVWIAEVAHSANAVSVPVASSKINGRDALLHSLQEALGSKEDQPFVAMFDARFDKETFAARSNGLFPDDPVRDRGITLFTSMDSDPVGGPILGDSKADGDQLNKHKALSPLQGAAVSLVIEGGHVSIIPIKGRRIGLIDNPHEFRPPLMQAQLEAASRKSDTHSPVVVIGGGIAGLSIAEKLARMGVPCTVIEAKEKLLDGTSGHTPGREGHGYHYRHKETALLYVRSTITFLRYYCNTEEKKKRFTVAIDQEHPENDCGLYFIRKDSQVPWEKLRPVYEAIRTEYARLVVLDPANKVLGEVDDFLQILDLNDFRGHVDVDKMAAVIRTQERLLNWPEFSKYLIGQMEEYEREGLVSIKTATEVREITYDDKEGFRIVTNRGILTASQLVNASWARIEELDSGLFPEAGLDERTNRIKLIVSIRVPEGKPIPCMFTAMGPFAMFSNEGGGKGKITYAPVTNMLDYVVEELKKGDGADPMLLALLRQWVDRKEIAWRFGDDLESLRHIECATKLPILYKRWLSEGLNLEEAAFFGQKILEGAIREYPILKGATVTAIHGGIVRSEGEVDIRDLDSKVHERTSHGARKRQIGFEDFNGVKLFFAESQSRNVARTVMRDMISRGLIQRQTANVEASKQHAVATYMGRYADHRQLVRGDSFRLDPAATVGSEPALDIVKATLEVMLNGCLREPRLVCNMASPSVATLVKSLAQAVIAIRRSYREGDPAKLLERQQTIIARRLVGMPSLFTIFSITDEAGNIIFDGRYGEITPEKREEFHIPCLGERDYFGRIPAGGDFVLGVPVVGSTSGERMIPGGAMLGGGLRLTFGMPIAGLMKVAALGPARIH